LSSAKWRAANPERNKDNLLKRLYGLSLDQYKEMFNNQGGRCCICKIDASELNRGLFVDHDHVTGKVRGLLCHRCNVVLGFIKENDGLIPAFADYINKHKMKVEA
jgi:hypothetical protein